MCADVSDAKIRETWEVLETPFYALPAGRVNKKNPAGSVTKQMAILTQESHPSLNYSAMNLS